MSKMMPPYLSDDIKSKAEKKIYEWFRTEKGTEDWIVLHSLGLVNHSRFIRGESDFVVLAPGLGMFVLEVKGGSVRKKDGVWYFTDHLGNTNKKNHGPFYQASEGMFSIREYLRNSFDFEHRGLVNLIMGYGVMFPDIVYSSVGCDESQWMAFDFNNGTEVKKYIEQLSYNYLHQRKEQGNKWYLPTADDCKYMATLLRGDFEAVVSLGSIIQETEQEIIRLTNEQYLCLDQLSDNDRCLITGGAGTGKTLLALEAAKRYSLQGYRVGLFCYNELLGNWLSSYVSKVGIKNVTATNIHKYIYKMLFELGEKPVNNGDKHYFDETLPNALKSFIEQYDMFCQFDILLVDESQDLITDAYMDLFNVLLKNGLSDGKWCLFGDFSNQAIFSNKNQAISFKDKLKERGFYTVYNLTVNCRNSKKISDDCCLLSGAKYPTRVLNTAEGVDVKKYSYTTKAEEKERVVKIIDGLVKEKIKMNDVVILSPKKREDTVVSLINEYKIDDYTIFFTNCISFSTIQSFKGLEKPIVILVDIDNLQDKNLLYVGMSRARAVLYFVGSKDVVDEYMIMGFDKKEGKNGYSK